MDDKPIVRMAASPWSAFVTFMIGAMVAGLALALWQARDAIMLAFASAVLAALLLTISSPIERYVGLGRKWALLVSGLALLAVIVGFVLSIGPLLQEQVAELQERIPQAVKTVQEQLSPLAADELKAADEAGSSKQQSSDGQYGLSQILSLVEAVIGRLATLGLSVVNGIAAAVIAVVGAFYLAADAGRYRAGIVMLFPPERHEQVDAALSGAGRALNLWLEGQLIAMALVGMVVGLGLWLIGVPSPLALGLFAGLTEFIPLIGPYLGAVPAVLIAATLDTSMLLWTVALFVFVQSLESSVITPLLQQRVADVPSFLMLFAVVALGLIFGWFGVLIAAPLTVVLYVLVKRLYIRETLGQPVPVPGDKPGTKLLSGVAEGQ